MIIYIVNFRVWRWQKRGDSAWHSHLAHDHRTWWLSALSELMVFPLRWCNQCCFDTKLYLCILKDLFLPFCSQPRYLFYILSSHRNREWGHPNIQFETYISEYEILRKINWIGKQLLASNIVLSQVNLHWILLNLSKSSLILS